MPKNKSIERKSVYGRRVSITVSMPYWLADKLYKRAEEEKKGISRIVRIALERYFEEELAGRVEEREEEDSR